MMSEEEKKAIEVLKSKRASEQLMISGKMCVDILLNLIENQQKELNNLKEIEKSHQEENGKLRVELEQEKEKNKELEKENTDLKELYIRTAKHQEKIGHTELAEYMLAQIQAIPTFTTWEEYTTWVSKDKIKAEIEDIIDYFEYANATSEDMDFLERKKKEILEEK